MIIGKTELVFVFPSHERSQTPSDCIVRLRRRVERGGVTNIRYWKNFKQQFCVDRFVSSSPGHSTSVHCTVRKLGGHRSIHLVCLSACDQYIDVKVITY